MEEVVRQDILSVLSDAEKYIRESKISNLKELSNHTIHNCSIFQDHDSIIIAVLIYSLSKVMEKTDGEFSAHALRSLAYARNNLLLNHEEEYQKSIQELMDYIAKTDSATKKYIQEVILQAMVKKGGRIYEHGISLTRAASILGVSPWELMTYVGQSAEVDEFISGRTRERLNFARSLFKK
ncbi:MAG: hypothetical protein QXW00_02265 [Candidatus Woesearchaeota archaeon]